MSGCAGVAMQILREEPRLIRKNSAHHHATT